MRRDLVNSTQRKPKTRGMTLLEILLVLGLMSMILGLIWGMGTLFSKNYLTSERKMSRAQLVRSISQMLSDDLAAAVQDPIHPFQNQTSETPLFVRRFGLRGDAVSLQIDVIEPNLFDKTATLRENREASSRSAKPPKPQVPELKTVFYEFTPLNAKIPASGFDSANIGPKETLGGSQMVGSLQTPTPESVNGKSSSNSAFDSDGLAMDRSELVRKYGLSRRELGYEIPDKKTAEAEKSPSVPLMNTANGGAAAGSLQTPNLPASDSGMPLAKGSGPDGFGTTAETDHHYAPFVTAAQLAMEMEDGTVWMPEVVDCRFRYFDGRRWLSRWDSIAQNGLPVAIEVHLKLMTLDDVEEIRWSPYLFQIASTTASNPNLSNNPNRGVGNGPIGSLSTPASADLAASPGISPGNVPGNSPEIRRMSIDEAADRMGLSAVMTRDVVAYLPTTPLARHQRLNRRKPLPAKEGNVANRQTDGAGSKQTAVNQTLSQGLTAAGLLGGSENGFQSGGDFGVYGRPTESISAFSGVDSLMTGYNSAAPPSGVPGMTSSATGNLIATQTKTNASEPPKKTGTQQTWIRGK